MIDHPWDLLVPTLSCGHQGLLTNFLLWCSDAGPLTCLSYPGSRFNEKKDAELFASFDVDYLKYDNCYAPASDWIVDRYVAMRDALNSTGRPIVFSM